MLDKQVFVQPINRIISVFNLHFVGLSKGVIITQQERKKRSLRLSEKTAESIYRTSIGISNIFYVYQWNRSMMSILCYKTKEVCFSAIGAGAFMVKTNRVLQSAHQILLSQFSRCCLRYVTAKNGWTPAIIRFLVVIFKVFISLSSIDRFALLVESHLSEIFQKPSFYNVHRGWCPFFIARLICTSYHLNRVLSMMAFLWFSVNV